MTDEQIKQNAVRYQRDLEIETNCILYDDMDVIHTFIAGAHSRDGEIEELQNEIESLRKGFYERGDKLKELMLTNNKLRNPWTSVEDRLPENNCVVFVSLDGTEYLSAHYRAKSKRFVTVSKDKQTLVDVRKSAATYAVCGDCIKEERFYSEGQREDITSLVTHWMSIPELNKEE